ncbi:hypothetical protein Fmac_014787 [Flemingia macrophylla]|uniref:Precursor of CEP9 n=1 Tax=Flemingia macrophylla TaxID=520843 RepID=A0ABD1MCT3_9FABA
MATFQATIKFVVVIFLSLVAFNGSLLTHARQIKPLNQHSWLNKGTVNVPTPSSEKKRVDSSVMPKQGVDESFADSSADANAFRPTTPGNSPGVGHKKFAQEDNGVKPKAVVQSPDVKLHVTEETQNGFKPTNPGHSPGVGHSQQNKIGQ